MCTTTNNDRMIGADELKKDFLVTGRFYNVKSGNQLFAYRSLLEIRRIYTKPDDKADANIADAVVIMMNPGSSEPLENAEIITIDCVSKIGGCPVVVAKPDITQYQIMRVMQHCSWDVVRVINLSDLREANSSNFYKQITDGIKNPFFSIFNDERKDELLKALARKENAPVICAWGVNQRLAPLVEMVLKHHLMKNTPLTGFVKEDLQSDATEKFYHPLPRSQQKQKDWVDTICRLIDGKES